MKNIYGLITLILLPLTISFAQNDLSKDFPILNKIYHADTKRADYIVVLDQSGSMRKYWNEVKNALSTLIDFLPNDDYLSILGFGSRCQPIVVPTSLNERIKNELSEQIRNLPPPSGINAQNTDLYEAIDKALDEINRPNSNQLKFVFFITDYSNDPPSFSKWNDSNIYLLREKYKRVVINTKRLMKLYALQLPLDINSGKDYDTFASIFQSINSPIFLTQNTLVEWFERLRIEIERDKLRLLVDKDLKNAIIIKNISSASNLFEKNSYLKFTIRNNSKLNLYIDSIEISTSNNGLMSKALQNFIIRPEEMSDLGVNLNEGILSLSGLLPSTYKINIDSIRVFASSREKVEFGKLNLGSTFIFRDDNTKKVDILLGFNYLQIIIFIFLLSIIIWILFEPCVKSVWLFHKKNIRVSMDINDKIVELTTREFSSTKKSLYLDNNIIVEDPQGQNGLRNIFKFTINFVVKKPKCVIRKPKPGTYVSIELPENANYSFTLYDSATGKGKEYKLGRELTSEPIDFRRGVKLETSKFEAGERYKLRIIINSKP